MFEWRSRNDISSLHFASALAATRLNARDNDHTWYSATLLISKLGTLQINSLFLENLINSRYPWIIRVVPPGTRVPTFLSHQSLLSPVGIAMAADALGNDHDIDLAFLSNENVGHRQQEDIWSSLDIDTSAFISDQSWTDLDLYLPVTLDTLPEPSLEAWQCSPNEISTPSFNVDMESTTLIRNSDLVQNIADITHQGYSALSESADNSPSGAVIRTDMQTQASVPQKSRRQRISLAARESLDTAFKRNPYPSNTDIDNFARTLDLPAKTIRTWFSNARARRNPEGERLKMYIIVNATDRLQQRKYPEFHNSRKTTCTMNMTTVVLSRQESEVHSVPSPHLHQAISHWSVICPLLSKTRQFHRKRLKQT